MKLPRKKTIIIFSCLVVLMTMLSMYYSRSEAEEPKQQKPAVTTGKIWGSVASVQNSEVLAGAKVMLDGTTMAAVSDKEGKYYIIKVPPGVYSVTAIYPGYKSIKLTDVKVKAGESTKLDFKMEASGELEALPPPPPPAPEGVKAPAAPEKPVDAEKFVDFDKPVEPVGGWKALQANLEYPADARDAKQEGMVHVKALIGIDGKVKAIVVEKSSEFESLNKAAVEAVKKTQWQPAMKGDEKVETWNIIPVKFKLD